MFTPEELALLERYFPLIEAELRRVGVSEEDQGWIHAGSDQRPTEDLLEGELRRLQSLPTAWGVRAYCQWLGFDYDQAKRELLIP